MDLHKIIEDLNNEKEALERTIALLQQLQTGTSSTSIDLGAALKRRGRKSMDSKEREEVSARMKRYWAQRRAQQRVAK